jgi:5-methylcytosine-specific restriction endonuclease McrA
MNRQYDLFATGLRQKLDRESCRLCTALVSDEAWRTTPTLAGLPLGSDAGMRTCARCLRQQREADAAIARASKQRVPSRPPLGASGGELAVLARLCPQCGRTLPDVPHTRGPCDECRPKYEREKSRRRRARNPVGAARDTKRWKLVRAQAKARDRHRCVTCGSTSSLSVHHVTPLDRGGQPFTPSNLVTLC